MGLSLWLSWLRICLQCGRPGFGPWVGKIPWRRERLPTPVFWPGEFHGVTKNRTWLSDFHFNFFFFSGKIYFPGSFTIWKYILYLHFKVVSWCPIYFHFCYHCHLTSCPSHFIFNLYISELPWWLRRLSVCLQCGRPRFNPWIWKISWRRKWQPTPVFLPGKSHGQKSLVGHNWATSFTLIYFWTLFLCLPDYCFLRKPWKC